MERFVTGQSFEAYQSDGMLRRAVERSVEIISEASRKLPAELIEAHPDVPWKKIRGIGDILRHAYPDVQSERIWDIATIHIRPLKAAVAVMVEAVERQEER